MRLQIMEQNLICLSMIDSDNSNKIVTVFKNYEEEKNKKQNKNCLQCIKSSQQKIAEGGGRG